ncbi:MAG TPA: hypothetical protein VN174_02635 [Candidatus Methanoperedens sp.]|nr:hypothetical protein [Candidatus Methanoperedens sp.]
MSQFNLTIKPAQIEIILKPNSTHTRAYEITNNSSETIQLTTSIVPWIPSDNSGSVIYLDTQETTLGISLSNADLKLGQDFLIKPNQKKQLVLKIKNIANDENDHYLTFFITQKPINSNSNHQNLAKIGSNILVSTTNENIITSNLEISQFNVSPSIKDIFSNIKINGEIYNKGNHYDHINGQIIISKNGQIYWENNLFPYTITTHNSRLLHCLNSNNEPQLCQLKIPIWPGVYEGKIIIHGNNSNNEYTFNFFVFPYLIVIITLISFIFLMNLLKIKKRPSSKNKVC